jgi:hypothetical protein
MVEGWIFIRPRRFGRPSSSPSQLQIEKPGVHRAVHARAEEVRPAAGGVPTNPHTRLEHRRAVAARRVRLTAPASL